MLKEMTTGDKVFGVVFLLLFGAVAGFWGCVVAEHDRQTEKLYVCAHWNMNEHGMGVEEAYIHCSRMHDGDSAGE